MVTLKMQAVNILREFPEDKMIYVVDVLKWLSFTFNKTNNSFVNVPDTGIETALSPLEAWNDFKKYKGIINCDINEKTELANARDEKYENFT